ncbi:MAG: hypothetical protein JXA67_12270 [Micromonosporaceae bacterium]|nr:hypothetical protein [Micromonosporaceae bacterium]
MTDVDGYGLELRVSGYQFPDAEDLRQRRSWHQVTGTAWCADRSWSFRYPALTCSDSPAISAWLRAVADACVSAGTASADRPLSDSALTFTEPNLAFAVAEYRRPEAVVVRIGLDLEYSPPWRRHHQAGDPFVLTCLVGRQDLLDAAAAWDEEIAPFPA